MGVGQSLVLFSVALQSLGKVLYGTFLSGVSVPLFILLSVCLTAVVCLVIVRARLPTGGRTVLVLVNVWTAASFIGFFFALKHLPPAILASIEIGMSLIAAIALVSVQERAWPPAVRFLACVGIVAGCAFLSWAEIEAAMANPNPALVMMAIAASAVTGIASALSAITSKKLAASGWAPASVLAHRFYLTIAVAAAWLPFEQQDLALPDATTLALIALVGAVAILTPLLLLQIALRRTDALTVMVCLAVQPILSFAISLPSPAYDWDTLTLLGVVVVTAFVGLDVVAQRNPGPASAAAPGSPRGGAWRSNP
jgi:drug/metabolite transporter (DMT)-like permease